MIFGKNVNRYYLRYWYFIVIGVVSLLVVDIFGSVIPPIIASNIIDSIDKGTLTFDNYANYLGTQALYLLGCAIISFISRFMWRFGFMSIGHRVARDLRHRMFANSLTLSQTFYSDNKVGGLMSYYINDVQAVEESFAWGIMETFDSIFLTSIILYRMFSENVMVTIFCLIPLVLILLIALFSDVILEKRYKTRQDNFEKLSDFTQESFSGIRVIKAFVRERKEHEAFMKKNKENEDANMRYLRFDVLFMNFIELFIWGAYFAIIFAGSYFTMVTGEISIAILILFIKYFDTLIWPMFAISEIINIRSRGKASLKRIDEILNAKTDLIDAENPVPIDNVKGEITFNHLSFKYPTIKATHALKDITFTIKPGEFVGIIGRTGSSKTTLVNLLLRLYNVNENELLIDGVDIMKYSIKDIRNLIGYVPQDNFLYSDTIESNIGFSSNIVDTDKIIKNAKIAGVHKDISEFPKGYSTILGERGVSVSGGQKQRISIARALYKDPKILILDDSLSAVDTKTEAEILSYLKEERKGRTTILIAHRVSSIKDADKILVLDNGGVLSGYDSHENLLKNNAIYKQIYNLQKLEEEGGVEHV
ncbi:ABC transporter ATP-binding protein [bacterium]|nr:ABC transporter ATP-binding protein [bacterium]